VIGINETHDTALRSRVDSANRRDAEFPIQNLPFGVFRRKGSSEAFRVGVAIGDRILDIDRSMRLGAFDGVAGTAASACASAALNGLMALGQPAWSALRLALSRLLRSGPASAIDIDGCLHPQADAEYGVPANIGDYTDFYTSIHHATAVGRMFRPDNPLLPNYKWIPIGYHGRSSTIGVSDHAFTRPLGQTMPAGAQQPVVGPSRRLDYECELGVFVGPGNAAGVPIAIDDAEQHVFGLCLLNDWSARDIQAWEYQPLGPFLSKNFATTVSPWVVTLDALAPYRAAWTRAADDPQPLPYLDSTQTRQRGAIDIQLEVWIETARMRDARQPPARLSRTTYKHAYWTVSQMVAHHTVNGCSLRPGDLLGSGTESGPAPDEAGSLLELSGGGRQPITLPGGEARTFLEDGDAVTLRGYCQRDDGPRIGFGECRGIVLPARATPPSQFTT
jgi:fumarylacetoacetase